MAFAKYAHLLSLVLWLGGMVFFSFIAAPSVFKVLNREMAGTVVGDIFPKYFLMGYVLSVVMLATLGHIAKWDFTPFRIQLGILVAATALTFVSGMVIGAKARAVKAQMYAEHDAGKKEALRKEFGKTHAVSSVVNLGIVILLLVYVWYAPMVVRPTVAETTKNIFGF